MLFELPFVNSTSCFLQNNGENELQRVPEGIDVMSEFQFIEEPNHQNLERTTSENDTNASATISSRKLRKRTAKSMADNLEGRIDGAEVDESRSSDEQEDETMPKPKRASRKTKGQTTEDPKPAKRGKKVSSVADSSVEESSKKKFPHSTRRKRRQGNYASCSTECVICCILLGSQGNLVQSYLSYL